MYEIAIIKYEMYYYCFHLRLTLYRKVHGLSDFHRACLSYKLSIFSFKFFYKNVIFIVRVWDYQILMI